MLLGSVRTEPIKRWHCAEVFDGRDATAPLLAHWTGQPTDSVLGGDTVTSTGRDMYLHFTSDVGNYGIEAAGALESTPGFYGEWQVIDHLSHSTHTEIAGHFFCTWQ